MDNDIGGRDAGVQSRKYFHPRYKPGAISEMV